MSGAAERMAKTFLKILGKGHEELAMAIACMFYGKWLGKNAIHFCSFCTTVVTDSFNFIKHCIFCIGKNRR